MGRKVLSILQNENGVMIRCSDGGSTVEGDILVGAGEAYSSVRQSLFQCLKKAGYLPASDVECLSHSCDAPVDILTMSKQWYLRRRLEPNVFSSLSLTTVSAPSKNDVSVLPAPPSLYRDKDAYMGAVVKDIVLAVLEI
ncbi:hypothetical protein BGZ50_000637 [Haplosporangium sp. Z 11]|nr:hypothetical protein BGZ50_000637 [Haplosporangium sp. Z 11]